MTIPDTTASASAFQQSKIATNVKTSVQAKVLNEAKQQGANVLQLLSSATPKSTTASADGSLDVTG